ncbi:MAG: hypothetical protein R3C58_13725 [Parvularculaceae bacterium]
MRLLKILGIGASAALLFAAAEAAPITLGGYDVDTDNFATSAELTYGGGRIFQEGGPGALTPTSLSDSLSGSNARDGLLCELYSCGFQVFFADGIQNQVGDDLVLYGLGDSKNEFFNLLINGVKLYDLELVDTGELIAGTSFALVALAIDLSDFGLALGDSITSIRISMMSATADKEEFSAFASLNSQSGFSTLVVDEKTLVNPLPASFILFLCGGAGILGAARRKIAKA